jgi:hypothetical protein
MVKNTLLRILEYLSVVVAVLNDESVIRFVVHCFPYSKRNNSVRTR